MEFWSAQPGVSCAQMYKYWDSLILHWWIYSSNKASYINCVISRPCWPTTSATAPYFMPAASIPAALHSVTLYQWWSQWPLYTPHPMCAYQDFLPSQSQWYMRWFIIQFVYELLPCITAHTDSFLQSAFMNSLVHCGHSVTLCLCHTSGYSVISNYLHSAQHQLHHQPSLPLHWLIDFIVCVLLIVCIFHY